MQRQAGELKHVYMRNDRRVRHASPIQLDWNTVTIKLSCHFSCTHVELTSLPLHSWQLPSELEKGRCMTKFTVCAGSGIMDRG